MGELCKKYCFEIAIIFWFLFFQINSYSQNEIKNWNSVSFSIQASKKINFNISQQSGFSFEPYDLDWMQLGFSGIYRTKRNQTLSLGYRKTIIFRSSENRKKHRLVAAYTLKSSLNHFRISNSIITEYHSKTETKYRYRIIYAFRLKTRKSIDLASVGLKPYFSSLFYYNIGGNDIAQYNNKGEYMGDFVPYGWHRMRFTFGLNFRFGQQMAISIYAMKQMEFNSDFATWNKMNVYNPEREKILRPFNNYIMIGWGLRHYLNRKTINKKNKRSEKSSEWRYFSPQDDY